MNPVRSLDEIAKASVGKFIKNIINLRASKKYSMNKIFFT